MSFSPSLELRELNYRTQFFCMDLAELCPNGILISSRHTDRLPHPDLNISVHSSRSVFVLQEAKSPPLYVYGLFIIFMRLFLVFSNKHRIKEHTISGR